MAHSMFTDDLMDEKDIRALLKAVDRFGQGVDYELLLHGLLRQGFITRGQYESLYEILNRDAEPRTRKYSTCLREIVQFMTLSNIVFVFNEIGLEDIAQVILKERYFEPKNQVTSTKCVNQELLEHLYCLLVDKREHGRTHVNMKVDFQNMTTYFLRKLQQNKDIRNRQKFLDCLAIVVRMRGFILEVQSEHEAILNELMNIKESHKDLDHTVTAAVYLISKVYIAREKHSVDEGEAYLVDVKQVCHHHSNVLLRTLIYVAEQAFYRRIYSETSDTTYQHKSLLACDNAIHSTTMKCFRPNNFLLISKVFTLAFLGRNLQIDHAKDLKQADVESAKAILGLLKSQYSVLGNREKVMYRVCMARVYERDNSKLALSNAMLAIELENSTYLTELEKHNLNIYVDYLKSIVR